MSESKVILDHKICCSVFPRVAKEFGWMVNYDNGCDKYKYKSNPLLYTDHGHYTMNHCPICGANIKGIKIPQTQWERDFA